MSSLQIELVWLAQGSSTSTCRSVRALEALFISMR